MCGVVMLAVAVVIGLVVVVVAAVGAGLSVLSGNGGLRGRSWSRPTGSRLRGLCRPIAPHGEAKQGWCLSGFCIASIGLFYFLFFILDVFT